MPVVIDAKGRSRERILAYGHEGTGKSSALLTIARAQPHRRFFIIDNDNAYDRLLETDFEDVAEQGNVFFGGSLNGHPKAWDDDHGFCTDADVNTWDGSKRLIQEGLAAADRDDWLVVDMTVKLWEYVQEWFIEGIHGASGADYFLQVRKEKQRIVDDPKQKNPGSLGGIEGWMDWPVINTEYFAGMSTPLVNAHCHLWMSTSANKISTEDAPEIKNLYHTGSKPGGQKGTGHLAQTVLQFSRNRQGAFKLTTIKDRGREAWTGQEFGEDFAKAYMVDTAGWKKGFWKPA